jgi:hypothetical protein
MAGYPVGYRILQIAGYPAGNPVYLLTVTIDHDNLLDFHQNIAVSPFLSLEKKILINLAL